MTNKLGRLGYYWSEKKSRKFGYDEFSAVCRSYGLELVKLDLMRPFEDQGPFVAIIHKLTDLCIKAESGDLQAKCTYTAFQNYVKAHPEVVIIDPLPNIMTTLNRSLLNKVLSQSDLCQGDIFIPAFVELNTRDVFENTAKMKAAGIEFPVVCKPTVAHGSSLAHQMSIIFNKEGLGDVVVPCVIQQFVNHNAVLYKLFCIGEKYFMIERPSLKNFTAGDQKTIHFNSLEISKPNSASELNELDDNAPRTPYVWPEKEKMDSIVERTYKCLGLSLVGIDVIVANKTGHYGIVDVNVFPGYDGVDNVFEQLCELIVKKISSNSSSNPDMKLKQVSSEVIASAHRKFLFCTKSDQLKASIPYQTHCVCCPIVNSCQNGFDLEVCSSSKNLDCAHDDSGIETSDSCDERKESCHRTMKRLHSRSQAIVVADAT